ncbi:hypothetical protein ABER02_04170 [Rossellomorea marisflavi]|uniref:hypothetical protein n=1 Tax=Rossellomorea TaxID=2837508 RepID=UPI001317A568|nr:hypothetical protein [Rossellomorea marisflavi]QHA35814.1 hypothetical protein D5E69_08285 [Rossellomorea marisflavi]USK93736.1 hypothetical protein LIT29_08390 [Rossellomorea marisflavi]
MDRFIPLMLASILAGFALLKLPLSGTFLEGISPVTDIIGIITILLSSLFLIYKGLRALFTTS